MHWKWYYKNDDVISVVPAKNFLVLVLLFKFRVTSLSFFKTKREEVGTGLVDFVCIVYID